MSSSRLMVVAIARPSTSAFLAPLLIRALLILAAFLPLDVSGQQTNSPSEPDNAGLDFFRPPPNLFQPMYQYQTAPGSTRETTTETLNLRLDHSVDLAPQWSLVFRADLPLLAKNPISASNPAGDFLYGVGDTDFQAAVIHGIDARWAIGFGTRLVTPTGGDTLGSGKWQILPLGGFRYSLWEINSSSYFEPIVRYDVSVAGDPTKRNISNLQFGPMLNLGLPDRWFFTLYPSQDIRWNFGDPVTGQTGRLFLPFDARIGRKLSGNAALSLEVGVPIIKDYPVYNFKTQVRLNLTY
jgi:hypothetical protein